MEDILGPRFGVPHGTLATAIKPETPMPFIAVDDIGVFVALAFDNPDAYLGKTIEIAGDVLTPPQLAATLSRAARRAIPYVQIPIETIRQQNAELALVYEFVNESSLLVDIPALRQQHPDLMDCDLWLKKHSTALFGHTQDDFSA